MFARWLFDCTKKEWEEQIVRRKTSISFVRDSKFLKDCSTRVKQWLDSRLEDFFHLIQGNNPDHKFKFATPKKSLIRDVIPTIYVYMHYYQQLPRQIRLIYVACTEYELISTLDYIKCGHFLFIYFFCMIINTQTHAYKATNAFM